MNPASPRARLTTKKTLKRRLLRSSRTASLGQSVQRGGNDPDCWGRGRGAFNAVPRPEGCAVGCSAGPTPDCV